MSADRYEFLLIGGGAASVSAARTLRSANAEASIAMVCGEPCLPYQRPPLTKGFLGGGLHGAQIVLHPREFYEQQAIRLWLGERVVEVDTKRRTVRLASGRVLEYGMLLVATGAVPFVPPWPNGDLAGIHCLHDVSEAEALREAAGSARRAVVLGAGFVGIEVADSLRGRGIEVTLVERHAHVMPQLRSARLSAWFERRCVEHGIVVRTGCGVRGFTGDGRLQGVECSDGTVIGCDLAVVAVGVKPACDFLAGSGIALDNGVVVDEFLQTSDEHVYAAGDVANFYDPVFGVRRRLEHLDNAVRQGKLAARNMLGQRMPYRDVSLFWGDVFDVSYNFLGNADESDDTVERGDLERGAYTLLYLRHDVLRATFSLGGAAAETAAAEELIRHRVGLHSVRNKLHDMDLALESLPSQTVMILQGGGALGAFEWGAIEALERKGVVPDIISAVSIGAFNGAIVASHPGRAAPFLEAFWRELAIAAPGGCEATRSALALFHMLVWGVPNFLEPRWHRPWTAWCAPVAWWTSYFDPAPVRQLIERHVDFDALATSPVRLLLGAVDVVTGEHRIFDSHAERLTADHLLASGSLPPAMPWAVVDGRAYWDGGIVSNSPLDLVIERCGRVGGRVFALDLFSGSRRLPASLLEVISRRDEIVYRDRVRNDLRFEEYANDFGDLVDEVMQALDAQTARRLRQRPHYVRLMGNRRPIRIATIALEAGGDGMAGRVFDFSREALAQLREKGHATALAVFEREQRARREAGR